MLEVAGLTVAYGPHRALEAVSLSVAPGEICVILGANGAGKSTLLKAVAGLVKHRPGARIAMNGRDIAAEKPHRIVEAGLALVPEGRGIFADLTVAENLELGAYGTRARQTEAERLAQVFALFPKLGERRRQVARTMSGGEQQMVAIGRALMSNPAILMLDEPSLGLSPLLTRELFRALRAIRDGGVGILLVEQNAKQSLAIADRGYLLENGRITGADRAERLARDPAVQAAYLGGAAAKAPPGAVAAASAPVPPPLSTLPAGVDLAGLLAERAAQIHRRHIEHLRAVQGGRVNGRPYAAMDSRLTGPGAPILSAQADELSRQATEFARRATQIQADHLADIRRRTAIWTMLSRARQGEQR
ncbi:MAG: hypothetical protein BroJett030_05240 [Alphaproteobacteria bacterium]|nr:MAG: hypothetical protein BroJett030_05240 [Alphaproteobacteria bacterium]